MLIIIFQGISSLYGQNVGIGTTVPTNSLHVVPSSTNDPIRIEGLNIYSSENSFLVVDTISGIVKHLPFDSLASVIGDSIDTDVDSMMFLNDTLYLYEDNQILKTYLPISLDTNLLDSLIISRSDTLYSIISDSLLNDSIWIIKLDSILGNSDTVYFNDTSYTLIRDSLLKDSLFIDSLISIIGDSIDTDVDTALLQDTILIIIEDGDSSKVNLQPIIDSALANADDNDWDINANGTGLEGNPGTNVASGTNSIAAGDGNVASGNYAVSLGQNNTATGLVSTSLGRDNDATGLASTIAGGSNNNSTNQGTVVGGGAANNATGSYATISGGRNNRATGTNTIVGGGWRNQSNGLSSAVVGGENDTATGDFTFIGGGEQNDANGIYSAIAGGSLNRTTGDYSVISGGSQNNTIGNYSVISGGRVDTAYSYGEWVGGIYSTGYTPNSTTGFNANDRLFVVGNGTSNVARSNGLVLYKNGSLKINEAYTLPNIDGTANQVLTTDGSGTVSWAAPAGGGTDDQNLLTPNLTGTTLNTHIENGASTSVDLKPIIDSAISRAVDSVLTTIDTCQYISFNMQTLGAQSPTADIGNVMIPVRGEVIKVGLLIYDFVGSATTISGRIQAPDGTLLGTANGTTATGSGVFTDLTINPTGVNVVPGSTVGAQFNGPISFGGNIAVIVRVCDNLNPNR